MILEAAILKVKPESSSDFESGFRGASRLLAEAPGYIGHELHKCVERADQYLLLVRWNSISDPIAGFRKSEAYRTWQELLSPWCETETSGEHYVEIRT
ncbi:antibiotic biosynthesis monooxygenase family protein [Cohnella caldifontis]|uniref:antibiotic biosynthesis monooxygenase family protein n=1 Tax=Cohnella caldifontis TaxID=3027471 RepID=UPI0023EAABF9|nr:antibiotic biosynthesis monooxygenase [Cohnella sp. YIM B05605]